MVGRSTSPQALRNFLPEPLGEQLERHCRIVTLRPGHIIIGHQDRTSDAFVVLDGTLRVELHSLNGKDMILAELSAGELIGEYAALDDQPRSATVTASSACTLASIPGDIFRRTVLSDPVSAEWLARRLVKRIRMLTERTFELNALAVRDRLHCELLRLGIDAGIEANRAVITPAPTHLQLASRIGTHREAVTREFQYLQKKGIIAQNGRTLTLNDISQLADIVRAAAGEVGVVQRATPPRPDEV